SAAAVQGAVLPTEVSDPHDREVREGASSEMRSSSGGIRSAGAGAGGPARSPRSGGPGNPHTRPVRTRVATPPHTTGGCRGYARARIRSRESVSHAPSFHPPSWPIDRLVWKGHGPE